ncbi:hypothetical protein AAG570_002407 [Ranatra chinensis]|uniref:Laccase n=1 Tax=Ranatra chinensis TaxID=642074 RepID=A0ABD0Y7X3_9HEMI
MTCEYNFTVGVETSMGLLCKDCPLKVDDCSLPGCIAAGGLVRTVIAANGQLPGPAILVCENDSVVVNVMNAMSTRSTTIHWHGINQRTTPYSDGVPYVTQCPIEPYTTFRYQFSAFPAGTHVWHGHSGYQEADGLFGQLVVRRKEPKEVESLYDYDLPEHTITVWHWFREQASVILPNNFRTAVETTGYALLINGKGSIKEFMVPNNPDEFAFTPREKFYVKQGFRYRFRLIFNSAVFCPIQVSVDNHTITAFASESSTFEPVEVDSIVLTAGERYDFVVNANQEVSCYWMRFRGFGDCTFGGLMVHEEASLCYYGTQQPDVHISTNYIDGERAGKVPKVIKIVRNILIDLHLDCN